MKHDWEYKKLGEVGTIITGSTPPTSNPKNYESKDICFVKPSDIEKEGITHISKAENYISNYAYNNSCRRLPKGSVLITCIGIIGKVGILEVDATCNQQINALVPKEELSSKYIAYALLSIKELMQSVANAPVVPIINKGQFSSFCIPLPPLPIQEQIVSELDKVSEIIEKKKQQMKELDNLAQSIFYDMFGDPVENEKGWEVKKLNTVCDVRDGTHDSPKYIDGGDYILITSKNIVDGKIDYSNVSYITKEDYDAINKRSKVDDGDIIMAMIGTIGKPIIVKMEGYRFCIKNVALIKFLEDSLVSNIYIQALLSSTSFAQHIMSKNQGGTQKFVALGTIRNLEIPIPPLSLQQSFAQKIEGIEKQKELITASIKEAQTLFDARMDYWFGE